MLQKFMGAMRFRRRRLLMLIASEGKGRGLSGFGHPPTPLWGASSPGVCLCVFVVRFNVCVDIFSRAFFAVFFYFIAPKKIMKRKMSSNVAGRPAKNRTTHLFASSPLPNHPTECCTESAFIRPRRCLSPPKQELLLCAVCGVGRMSDAGPARRSLLATGISKFPGQGENQETAGPVMKR